MDQRNKSTSKVNRSKINYSLPVSNDLTPVKMKVFSLSITFFIQQVFILPFVFKKQKNCLGHKVTEPWRQNRKTAINKKVLKLFYGKETFHKNRLSQPRKEYLERTKVRIWVTCVYIFPRNPLNQL